MEISELADIQHGSNDWTNIQSIVRTQFLNIYRQINTQNQQLLAFEQQMRKRIEGNDAIEYMQGQLQIFRKYLEQTVEGLQTKMQQSLRSVNQLTATDIEKILEERYGYKHIHDIEGKVAELTRRLSRWEARTEDNAAALNKQLLQKVNYQDFYQLVKDVEAKASIEDIEIGYVTRKDLEKRVGSDMDWLKNQLQAKVSQLELEAKFNETRIGVVKDMQGAQKGLEEHLQQLQRELINISQQVEGKVGVKEYKKGIKSKVDVQGMLGELGKVKSELGEQIQEFKGELKQQTKSSGEGIVKQFNLSLEACQSQLKEEIGEIRRVIEGKCEYSVMKSEIEQLEKVILKQRERIQQQIKSELLEYCKVKDFKSLQNAVQNNQSGYSALKADLASVQEVLESIQQLTNEHQQTKTNQSQFETLKNALKQHISQLQQTLDTKADISEIENIKLALNKKSDITETSNQISELITGHQQLISKLDSNQSQTNKHLKARTGALDKQITILQSSLNAKAEEIESLKQTLLGKCSLQQLQEAQKSFQSALQSYEQTTQTQLKQIANQASQAVEDQSKTAQGLTLVLNQKLQDLTSEFGSEIDSLNSSIQNLDSTLKQKLGHISSLLTLLENSFTDLQNTCLKPSDIASTITSDQLHSELASKADLTALQDIESKLQDLQDLKKELDLKVGPEQIQELTSNLRQELSGKAQKLKQFAQDRAMLMDLVSSELSIGRWI